MREVKLIKTEDGSHSLFLADLNETYHSQHGAMGESAHVFIKMGLEHWLSQHPDAKSLKLFELGFGTGLNALLAYQAAEKYQIEIRYTTLEPYPISEDTIEVLNYGVLLEEGIYQDVFQSMHSAPWNEPDMISPRFKLIKYELKLEEFMPSPGAYDLVFFDAFAPGKQAELWEKKMLEKVALSMAPGAVFTTYCAKGQLKRDLKDLGLILETLQGAPGKKEMVRATKPEA